MKAWDCRCNPHRAYSPQAPIGSEPQEVASPTDFSLSNDIKSRQRVTLTNGGQPRWAFFLSLETLAATERNDMIPTLFKNKS